MQLDAQLSIDLQAQRALVGHSHGCGRHKFLKSEDDQLRALVDRFGEADWNLISSHMNRRNARQCRERYKNYLSPVYRNTPWSTDEEQLLAQKVNELGQKWSAIAKFFEARSDVNVKNHWAAMVTRNERVMRFAQVRPKVGVDVDQLWLADEDERGSIDLFNKNSDGFW
jgi:hypothetical protein